MTRQAAGFRTQSAEPVPDPLTIRFARCPNKHARACWAMTAVVTVMTTVPMAMTTVITAMTAVPMAMTAVTVKRHLLADVVASIGTLRPCVFRVDDRQRRTLVLLDAGDGKSVTEHVERRDVQLSAAAVFDLTTVATKRLIIAQTLKSLLLPNGQENV